MTKAKPVLIAVDLTPHSPAVVREGLAAARAFGTHLVLMHVVHELDAMYGIYLGGGSVTSLQADIDAQARRELERLFDEHLEDADVECETLLRTGVPWSEIVGAALHYDARMVVVGAHVLTKPEHRVLGSTTERVLRRATCPVLVVPAEI